MAEKREAKTEIGLALPSSLGKQVEISGENVTASLSLLATM